LAAVLANGTRAGLAHVDVSTGEFRATELELSDVGAALENLNAREVLVPEDCARLEAPCLKTEVEAWLFAADHAERNLLDHFKLLALDGCGLEGKTLAIGAAGAILYYLRETQKSALSH